MRLLPLAFALASLSTPALAADDAVFGAVRLSTLGLGFDYGTTLGEHFNLRAQANFAQFDREFEGTDIEYDTDVQLLTAGLIVDFYPGWWDGFRFTGGAYTNQSALDLTKEGPGTYLVGGDGYAVESDFRIDGDVEFDSVAPYLGVGYDYKLKTDGLYFSFDAGLLMAGNPTVDLDARGTVTPVDELGNPTGPTVRAESDTPFRYALKKEQDAVADDVEDFTYYITIGFALTYRF